jgi:hypothetical protein
VKESVTQSLLFQPNSTPRRINLTIANGINFSNFQVVFGELDDVDVVWIVFSISAFEANFVANIGPFPF